VKLAFPISTLVNNGLVLNPVNNFTQLAEVKLESGYILCKEKRYMTLQLLWQETWVLRVGVEPVEELQRALQPLRTRTAVCAQHITA
jgi:hypothetical protein